MKSTEKMTFDEFKTRIIAKVGARHVHFREVGKDGWTSVDDILAKDSGGRVGPHWCDACHCNPLRQTLIGKYDFPTQTATFFE